MVNMDGRAPVFSLPEPDPRHVRTVIAAAIVAGLALRLAFGLIYWTGKPLTLDEQEYILLARNVVRGHGLTYDGGPANVRHFERPPAYALFIAGILGATGTAATPPGGDTEVPASVKIVQTLLGGLTIWLIARIARRAAGARAAMVAAWLAALYPPLLWIAAYLLSEALYVVLALLAVWYLGEAIDQGPAAPRWPAFAAGVVAGIGVLTKEAMVFFLILAVAWLLVRRRLAVLALLLAGAVVTVAPWTVRNYAVHGRFVLGAPHGGVTFWTGNNRLAHGEGDMAANPELRLEQIAFEAQHQGLSVEQLDSLYYKEAIGYIVSHPLWWAALEAKKLFYTLVPVGPSYRLHSNRYFIASLVSYLALLPFAIAGIVRLARRPNRPHALWLMAGSALVVSVAFFPQERFRIPIVDPTLVVCAAACLTALWEARISHAGRTRTQKA
jgi:4-amino-4-deoxy-L-arabinose transferase-like glycosyltransferase